MKIHKLEACSGHTVNVVIETPKGSQNKFSYDSSYRIFRLKKSLPMGSVFPFDFGFIPNTEGEDGDPLDVLVIMDQPAYPGCLVECRLLGVFTALQSEDGKEIRNDRFIAVAASSVMYKSLDDIKSLNKSMVQEIENFFVDYNKHEGKTFKPMNWYDKKKAFKMLRKHIL